MTALPYRCGTSAPCQAQRQPCSVRLSAVGTCLAPGRSTPGLCRRKLFQHHRTCPLVPLSALAAADAFRPEPSVGASIAHRLRQAQQALTSPLDKEIISVAAPAFVGLALEPVVNAFNAGLVGHLGTHQLSAVSLGTIALNSCTFLFSFLLFLTVPEIAAAVAKKDDEEVSRVTAQSLWVALGCGLITAAAVGLGAQSIVTALSPPEPAVAAQATQYIMVRSLGIPAVLLGFVSTGVFRGFKDTRTPLLGTGTSVAVSFCLHMLLLNVLHLDVVGAAAAAALASCSSCAVMMGAMVARGKLRLRHLASPPPLSAVLPILQRGVVLAARNAVSFGMILFASTLCVRMGSAFQASFEVVRQMWMLTMPFFECLNVATQSLCATALGHQDRSTARALLFRLLSLGIGVGALAGAAVWAAHGPLIGFFTSDPAVVAHVLLALPLVCAFFPIDAAGSIMDGSLLAAKQSNYMSAVQIAGSAVQYLILVGIAGTGHVDTLSIWVAIKVMGVTRILGGVLGLFVSRSSAYVPLPLPQQPKVGAAPTAAASSSSSNGGARSGGASSSSSDADGPLAPPTVAAAAEEPAIDSSSSHQATTTTTDHTAATTSGHNGRSAAAAAPAPSVDAAASSSTNGGTRGPGLAVSLGRDGWDGQGLVPSSPLAAAAAGPSVAAAPPPAPQPEPALAA